MNFFRVFSTVSGLVLFFFVDSHACSLFSQKQSQNQNETQVSLGFRAPADAINLSFGDRVSIEKGDEGPRLRANMGRQDVLESLRNPIGIVAAWKIGIIPGRRLIETWVLEKGALVRLVFERKGLRRDLTRVFAFDIEEYSLGKGPHDFQVITRDGLFNSTTHLLVRGSEQISVLSFTRGMDELSIHRVEADPENVITLGRHTLDAAEIYFAVYDPIKGTTSIQVMRSNESEVQTLSEIMPWRLAEIGIDSVTRSGYVDTYIFVKSVVGGQRRDLFQTLTTIQIESMRDPMRIH